MKPALAAALAALALSASGCVHLALLAGAMHSVDAPFYARGTLLREPGGRQIGRCLEIAGKRYVPSGSLDESFSGFATEWRFGNTCDSPQLFDLGAVRAWTEDTAGERHPARAFDPRNELVAVHLDPLLMGSAVVQYSEPTEIPAGNALRLRVCFDVSPAVHGAAGATAAAPLCIPLGAAERSDGST